MLTKREDNSPVITLTKREDNSPVITLTIKAIMKVISAAEGPDQR